LLPFTDGMCVLSSVFCAIHSFRIWTRRALWMRMSGHT